MDSRSRVLTALGHVQPDVVPIDYFAAPEIQARLFRYFGIDDEDRLRDILDTDVRYINPVYIGPPLPQFSDGSYMDLWGVIRKPVSNEYGDYAEAVNLPYQKWDTVEEAERFDWPNPDWFDYSSVAEQCKRYPTKAIALGSFFVQDFINGTARGRGFEQTFMDIATGNPVFKYIVERRHRFYLDIIERSLEAARGRIDLVLCGDDFGSQRGLLISPESFDALFRRKKQDFFDMAHAHGAKITHNCCGSSEALMSRFIALKMDALQTIQPSAEGMNPFALKKKYGERITFHGAIDVQGWLQRATNRKIQEYLTRLVGEVGLNGGLICSPSHFLQPDIPLEKILCVYDTLQKIRGKQGFLSQ